MGQFAAFLNPVEARWVDPMKLCSSVFISVIFHAGLLFLSLSRFETRSQDLIPVVVFGLGEAGGGGKTEGRGGGGVERRWGVKNLKTKNKDQPVKGNGEAAAGTIPSEHNAAESGSRMEATSDAGVMVADTNTNVAGEVQRGSAAAGNQTGGSGQAAVRHGTGGGLASGHGGLGVGAGDGRGGGGGTGDGGSPFARASYADCRKPEYPERARWEGWEGTVTVRVLVDEEGKSKSLEVNHSSGYPLLDKAAMEALRRCRFNPARQRERPVESWIRIPVVFRLADLKD